MVRSVSTSSLRPANARYQAYQRCPSTLPGLSANPFLNSLSAAAQSNSYSALTARSIADAVRRFVVKASPGGRNQPYAEMILSGGGAKNPTLVRMLSNQLASLGIKIRFSDEFGLPSEAKEAVAFAMLAYETWHRRPSNLPSATGAKRAAVLGKISYP